VLKRRCSASIRLRPSLSDGARIKSITTTSASRRVESFQQFLAGSEGTDHREVGLLAQPQLDALSNHLVIIQQHDGMRSGH